MRIKRMICADPRPRKETFRERLPKVLDGRFRLEACLGAGGTGAVYRARTLELEGDVAPASSPVPPIVAVKILHPHLVADRARREVFLKEARIAKLVDHPGAVRVYDARVSADGTAYLVLELLEGKSLETALVGWGDLLVEEVVRVTRGILAILAAAHERGVVHCDVKPENVFVLADGKVKLVDFGVARITGEARRIGVAGTASFMAPEQARGDWARVDARADVWSVGATFYRLIEGKNLPAGVDASTLDLPIDVPPAIADVVRRALAHDPEGRYPDAGAMLEALREAADRAGLPRSSRVNVVIEEDEDDDEPLRLVVPPYPVSLEAITTPLPLPVGRATVPAPAPASVAARTPRRFANQWLFAAMVVAAAGVIGAALALALTSNLEDATRARMPKAPASVQVTAGEVRR